MNYVLTTKGEVNDQTCLECDGRIISSRVPSIEASY